MKLERMLDERTFDKLMKRVFPQKEKILDEQYRKKRDILISQLDEHNRKREKFLQEDPNISDIKRRIDDNDLQMLKLIEANKILLAAAASHIDEKIEEFEKENPTTLAKDLQEVEEALRATSPFNWNYPPNPTYMDNQIFGPRRSAMIGPTLGMQPGTTGSIITTGSSTTHTTTYPSSMDENMSSPQSVNELINQKTKGV